MPKARELGIAFGRMEPGKNNCITDVPGVRVGHVTLEGPLEGGGYACTGVTAILPHRRNLFREKVVAAAHVINGFGKTIGLVQVEELGVLESPILLTNTFGVPCAAQGALQYMLERTPEIGESTGTVNVVVGECNDMHLNSIRAFPVRPEHAVQALEAAGGGPAPEGAVGAGKGMVCFDYKGGIGCSSRLIPVEEGKAYTLGVLALTNFGSRADFPVERYAPSAGLPLPSGETPDGSILMVLATDAPLSSRQLKRVAKRCGAGLARTGSYYGHGSGDIVIAFSTAATIPHAPEGLAQPLAAIREDGEIINRLFLGAAEATEEAILNSLAQAQTTVGRDGRTVHAWRPLKS